MADEKAHPVPYKTVESVGKTETVYVDKSNWLSDYSPLLSFLVGIFGIYMGVKSLRKDTQKEDREWIVSKLDTLTAKIDGDLKETRNDLKDVQTKVGEMDKRFYETKEAAEKRMNEIEKQRMETDKQQALLKQDIEYFKAGQLEIKQSIEKLTESLNRDHKPAHPAK